jgi:putative transposase
MARLPRLDAPGHCHLVILPVVAGRPLAPGDADRLAWLAALHEAMEPERVVIHAWALRPDAAWLLLTPEASGSLGRAMQALGRRYVAGYHRRHGSKGPLWAGRFRAAVVEPGAWRLAATLWVDAQGQAPGGFSSDSARAGVVPRPGWLSDPPELWALGNTPFEREASWQARLNQGVSSTQAETLGHAAQGNWVVGSIAFASALAETLGRPTRPRPRGRYRSGPAG